jgi:hypothetical protein
VKNTYRFDTRHAAFASSPIEATLGKFWPEARLKNLLDDNLSADRSGYTFGTGANAILFTRSAFASCLNAVKVPEISS